MNRNFIHINSTTSFDPEIREVRFEHGPTRPPNDWEGWPKKPNPAQFEHGPANSKPLNPVEKLSSRTAKDRLGFPTFRKIIDAKYVEIS